MMILPPLKRSRIVLIVHVSGWALGALVLLYPLLPGVDGQRQPDLQPLLAQRSPVHSSVSPSVHPAVRQASHRFIPPRRGLPDRREGGGSF